MKRKIINSASIDSNRSQRLLDLSESLASSIRDSIIEYCHCAELTDEKSQIIFDVAKDYISLLSQENWNIQKAHSIGKRLYQLDLLQPENLSLVQKAFLNTLSLHLLEKELLVIFPRVCLINLDIISGFIENTQNKLLLEQEQIRSNIEKAKDEAENARLQIETRHNVIVENIPEIIIIIDLSGDVIYYHPGKRNPNQLARNMEKINIIKYISKELFSEFYELSKKAISTGKNQILTTTFPFQNQMRIFEGRIAPYTENQTITIVRDITDIIESENALKKSQASLQEMTRQLISVQEYERHQISLELHDQVLSQLGALLIFMDDTSIPKEYLDNYHKLIEQIRNTIYSLRPPMLNYGLYPALEDFHAFICNHIHTNSKILLDISPSDLRFDSNTELHLFRIIQEATTNALKHSRADQIIISGHIEPDEIQFSVEDNGIGIPYGDTIDLSRVLSNNHFGMAGMFERAVLISAEISYLSKPEQGTKVLINWKMQQ